MGTLLGVVFGGITAIGAAHGDSTIRSGLGPAQSFVLSLAGWTSSATLIAELWKHARSERSAIWVSIGSVVPFVLTSLMIASPGSEFLLPLEVVSFIVCEAIAGVVVGELGWKYFGPLSSHDQENASEMRE